MRSKIYLHYEPASGPACTLSFPVESDTSLQGIVQSFLNHFQKQLPTEHSNVVSNYQVKTEDGKDIKFSTKTCVEDAIDEEESDLFLFPLAKATVSISTPVTPKVVEKPASSSKPETPKLIVRKSPEPSSPSTTATTTFILTPMHRDILKVQEKMSVKQFRQAKQICEQHLFKTQNALAISIASNLPPTSANYINTVNVNGVTVESLQDINHLYLLKCFLEIHLHSQRYHEIIKFQKLFTIQHIYMKLDGKIVITVEYLFAKANYEIGNYPKAIEWIDKALDIWRVLYPLSTATQNATNSSTFNLLNNHPIYLNFIALKSQCRFQLGEHQDAANLLNGIMEYPLADNHLGILSAYGLFTFQYHKYPETIISILKLIALIGIAPKINPNAVANNANPTIQNQAANNLNKLDTSRTIKGGKPMPPGITKPSTNVNNGAMSPLLAGFPRSQQITFPPTPIALPTSLGTAFPSMMNYYQDYYHTILEHQQVKSIKQFITSFLSLPAGLEQLIKKFPTNYSRGTYEIYSYLANLVKEYSAITLSIKLYEMILPVSNVNNAHSILQLIHLYEIWYDYELVLDIIYKFDANNLKLTIGKDLLSMYAPKQANSSKTATNLIEAGNAEVTETSETQESNESEAEKVLKEELFRLSYGTVYSAGSNNTTGLGMYCCADIIHVRKVHDQDYYQYHRANHFQATSNNGLLLNAAPKALSASVSNSSSNAATPTSSAAPGLSPGKPPSIASVIQKLGQQHPPSPVSKSVSSSVPPKSSKIVRSGSRDHLATTSTSCSSLIAESSNIDSEYAPNIIDEDNNNKLAATNIVVEDDTLLIEEERPIEKVYYHVSWNSPTSLKSSGSGKINSENTSNVDHGFATVSKLLLKPLIAPVKSSSTKERNSSSTGADGVESTSTTLQDLSIAVEDNKKKNNSFIGAGGACLVKCVPLPIPKQINPTVYYSERELDWIALLVMIVKAHYLQGNFLAIPYYISMIETIRRAAKLQFHETMIRNEMAYYTAIVQLVGIRHEVGYSSCYEERLLQSNKGPAKPIDDSSPNEFVIPSLSTTYCLRYENPATSIHPFYQQARMKPLYVCGDSHILAPAWQCIIHKKQLRLLVPKLVTGVKQYHLRKDSFFYTKEQFIQAMKQIPAGSEIIMVIGEIDCREGILLAVEQDKYNCVEEGMVSVIKPFLSLLQHYHQEKQFKFYIHPIPPVLNETRSMTMTFNTLYKQEVAALQDPQIQWLEFFEQLLEPPSNVTSSTIASQSSIAHLLGRKLQSQYHLDGTHLHPRYLKLLESAMNSL